MSKLTVLQMTQKILSSISSDEVNSINDTVESLQVVDIIEDVYNEMIASRDVPEMRSLLQVEGLADVTKPNYMKLPTTVDKLEYFKYNAVKTGETDPAWNIVDYFTPDQFLDRVQSRTLSDTDVTGITDDSGVVLLVRNDKTPEIWTTFDDEYMVFDSYDSVVDTTLQTSKSLAYGLSTPVFSKTDDYTPDLDTTMFPYLLAECKSIASVELKQTANPKAERSSRKQKIAQQRNRHRFSQNKTEGQPDYGRN